MVPLRNLAQDDATTFLYAPGAPAGATPGVLSFTGGNPLALPLAVAIADRQDANGTLRGPTGRPAWT